MTPLLSSYTSHFVPLQRRPERPVLLALFIMLLQSSSSSNTNVGTTNTSIVVSGFVISDFVTNVLPKRFTGHTRPKPDLSTLVQEIIMDSILNLRLDIHKIHNDRINYQTTTEQQSQKQQGTHPPIVGLSADGLIVHLLSNTAESTSHTTNTNTNCTVMNIPDNTLLPLPGAQGPFPAISSGSFPLHIVEPGNFVDMTGMVKLPFDLSSSSSSTTSSSESSSTGTSSSIGSNDNNDDNQDQRRRHDHHHPSWELVWNENSIHGQLILAIQLSKSISRNNKMEAMLPGNVPIYITFQVWDRTTLLQYQERKKDVLMKAKAYITIRDHELQLMQTTNNIFQKIIHYKNAADAVEMYSLYPVHAMSTHIPDMIDLIPLVRSTPTTPTSSTTSTSTSTVSTASTSTATTNTSASTSNLLNTVSYPTTTNNNIYNTTATNDYHKNDLYIRKTGTIWIKNNIDPYDHEQLYQKNRKQDTNKSSSLSSSSSSSSSSSQTAAIATPTPPPHVTKTTPTPASSHKSGSASRSSRSRRSSSGESLFEMAFGSGGIFYQKKPYLLGTAFIRQRTSTKQGSSMNLYRENTF